MLTLLEARGQFLFQVKPSLFPEGELTTAEVIIWEKYYSEKKSRDK
jgi:hypothetical protein